MSFEPENQPVKSLHRPGISSRRKLWRDVLEIILLIVTIYTCVNLSTARAIVEGSSMKPNFETGQLVIVNRFAYYFGQPERGDVVILHNPAERCKNVVKNRSVISLPFIVPAESDHCEDLIKRVIGLPGETVEIRPGELHSELYVNGTLIEEAYIFEKFNNSTNKNWKLADNQYFVLGDNRNNSYDGSEFGPITRDLIVGQAWVRYWPLNDATVIQHPDYPPIASTYTLPPTATPYPTSQPVPDFVPDVPVPGGPQGVPGV